MDLFYCSSLQSSVRQVSFAIVQMPDWAGHFLGDAQKSLTREDSVLWMISYIS